MIPRLSHFLLAAGLALAASGCGLLNPPRPVPTEFYVLSGVHGAVATASPRRLSLGLGPIQFPSYLNRPEMVSRVAENQLAFDEFHRWGEPLHDNFTHVLASDLDTRLGLARVTYYPWYNTTPMDFAVAVAVLRFEPQPSGAVLLRARWTVTNGRDPAILATRTFEGERPGGTPEENAAALSALLGDLADDIAATLNGLR